MRDPGPWVPGRDPHPEQPAEAEDTCGGACLHQLRTHYSFRKTEVLFLQLKHIVQSIGGQKLIWAFHLLS